jgi:hypothetical protein
MMPPIEKVFAKLKGALRKAQAPTIAGIMEQTARALPTVSAKECAGGRSDFDSLPNHVRRAGSIGYAGYPAPM